MAKIAKPKVDHETRMNWGGCFPHPVEDTDVLNRLPSWRQAEIRETHELIEKYPNAQLFLIYDPSTREPYPDQILYSDIEKKLKAERQALPEVPAGFKYTIPNGVPLGVFSYQIPEPTEDEAYGIFLVLEKCVTRETVVATCIHEKELVADKPMNGVFAFIWRLARYYIGADTALPVTAFFDLIDGVSSFTHFKVDPSRVKTIMRLLESKAEELVDAVGGSRYAGSQRWARAAGLLR